MNQIMLNYNTNLKTLKMLISNSQKLTLNREYTEAINTNNKIIFITSFLIESDKLSDNDKRTFIKLLVNTIKWNASLIQERKSCYLIL